MTVSYTHLDVYKRQDMETLNHFHLFTRFVRRKMCIRDSCYSYYYFFCYYYCTPVILFMLVAFLCYVPYMYCSKFCYVHCTKTTANPVTSYYCEITTKEHCRKPHFAVVCRTVFSFLIFRYYCL